MKKILLVGALAATLLSSCGSTPAEAPVTDGRLRVSASFYPVYFVAKEIAGDTADVTNITPAGAEPHDFEPSVRDRVDIESAGLFVMNGGVEAWGEKIAPELAEKGMTTVTAGRGAMDLPAASEDHTQGDDHDHAGSAKDPHVWLSPKRAKTMAGNILRGYESADPANTETYAKNASELAAALDALDQEYSATLAGCARKEIVTSHAAFGYLAADYGLTQIALSGISPESEPSAESLSRVVETVRTKHIPVIFSETLVSPRLSETVARETGARTLTLNPLEGLTKEEISAGKDYFSVMRENLSMLSQALDCAK
jgi:zinc transport system substrate-binding protein